MARPKSKSMRQDALLAEIQMLRNAVETLSGQVTGIMEWVWERQSVEESLEKEKSRAWQQVCSPYLRS